MSRYVYNQVFVDTYGNVVTSGTILVYDAGTSDLATIYVSEAGAQISGSEITSDSTTGTFSFWVDSSDYALSQKFKLVMSKTGYTTQTYDNVVVFIAIEDAAADGTTKGFATFDADDFDSSSGKIDLADSVLKSMVIDGGDTVTPASNSISLTSGSGIDIFGADYTISISAEDATTTNKGISELATDAETIAGTDTARVTTPSNITALIRGASFPASPAVGQDFYRTDLKTQFKYANSKWFGKSNYDTLNLYVDKSGADSAGKGFASGSDGTLTYDYVEYLIPKNFVGTVNLYLGLGTFEEILDIVGKVPGGNYDLNVIGTLTQVIAETALDSAVNGTGATYGSITKAGAFSLILDTTLNDAACNAGDTSFTLTSVVGLAANQRIVIDPATAGAGPEPHRIVSVVGSLVTIDGKMQNSYANGIRVIISGNADQLILNSSGGDYRVIDWNTENTAYVVRPFAVLPAANFSVWTQGTIFNYLYLGPTQSNIKFYNIKFSGNYNQFYPSSILNLYRCYLQGTGTYSLFSPNGQTTLTAENTVFYTSTAGGYGIRQTLGDYYSLTGCVLNGGYVSDYGLRLSTGGKVNIKASVIEGFDVYGTWIEGISYGTFYASAAQGYSRVRNNATGVYRAAGGSSVTTNNIYSGNLTADETLL